MKRKANPKSAGFWLILATALSVLPASVWSASVAIRGRQLLLNGAPFTMQGVAYSPTPVGARVPTYIFWTDAATPFTTDFPLIKTMGGNTIRTFDATQASKAALDAASSNGIEVIMGIPVAFSDVQTSSGQAAFIAKSTAVVSAWATHPAVLMWELGNEVTIGQVDPVMIGKWYSTLNQAAATMKALEVSMTGTFHPVSTSNKDISNIGNAAVLADDAHMTSLDVWGATVYRGSTFVCPTSVFVQYSTSSAKPFYFSEFGSDAFNPSTNQEDQNMQSAVIRSQWVAIESNLSAVNSANVLIGGNVFEWSDEWWKSLFNTSDGVQDAPAGGDFLNPCYTVTQQFEEWFGITSIRSGTTARGLRQAYYTLQSLWNPNGVAGNQNGPLVATIQNFPNPFQAGARATRIRIQLNQPATLTLGIFDMGGHKVIELSGPQDLGGNLMQYQWSGQTGGGGIVAAGLYILRVEASISNRDEVSYHRIVAVK